MCDLLNSHDNILLDKKCIVQDKLLIFLVCYLIKEKLLNLTYTFTHRGCIYLIKNTVLILILENNITI